jgi:hypothetical protein
VVRNPHTVLSTLMKVAGGTQKHKAELDIDAFIEQADSFGKMQDEGFLGRYITIFQTLFRSHPYPIWRAKEVMDWVSSGSFLEIMDGDYKVRAMTENKSCVSCSKAVNVDAMICPHCGASQAPEPEVDPDHPVEEDPLKRTWKDVTGWYKRTFTMDDPEPTDEPSEGEGVEGDVVEGDPPRT